MYYGADDNPMITAHLMALKASTKTLLLIDMLATGGSAVLTLVVGSDANGPRKPFRTTIVFEWVLG